tara:strand:+ start:799 stop:1362 length:564 start_codon:yes stop_codon:yes gene_type:complete
MNTDLINNLENYYLEIKCSEKIFLKILTPDKVTDEYVAWLNDNEVIQYIDQCDNTEDFNSVKQYVQDKYSSSYDLLFGIYYEDKHIGNIRLGANDLKNNLSFMGYLIGNRDYWGKGICRKVLIKLTAYAFEELGLYKIESEVISPNIASQKTLINSGFSLEGVRKNHCLIKGERYDILVFTKIRPVS